MALRMTGEEGDMTTAILFDFLGTQIAGELASRVVKLEYPNLPPFVGCTIVYYRSLVDKEQLLKYRNWMDSRLSQYSK